MSMIETKVFVMKLMWWRGAVGDNKVDDLGA